MELAFLYDESQLAAHVTRPSSCRILALSTYALSALSRSLSLLSLAPLSSLLSPLSLSSLSRSQPLGAPWTHLSLFTPFSLPAPLGAP